MSSFSTMAACLPGQEWHCAMYNEREPKTVTNTALDKLPLFATDLEIAVAIVGKQRASRWKREALPALRKSGFPRPDPLHGGVAVPLVKHFYALYFDMTAGVAMGKTDGEERLGQWSRRRNNEPTGAIQSSLDRSGVIPPPTPEERRARAKAAADAWEEKKRKGLEEFNARKAEGIEHPARRSQENKK